MDTCNLLGGVVLLLNAPDNLNFGIDYSMWKTGPKFMGIKQIPSGPHFIYWTVDEAEEIGTPAEQFRFGNFIFMEENDIIVRQWSTATELFERVQPEEEDRYKAGVRRLDFLQNLGPYPKEWSSKWYELSRYISKQVIERIEPVSRLIAAAPKEYDEDRAVQTSDDPNKLGKQDIDSKEDDVLSDSSPQSPEQHSRTLANIRRVSDHPAAPMIEDPTPEAGVEEETMQQEIPAATVTTEGGDMSDIDMNGQSEESLKHRSKESNKEGERGRQAKKIETNDELRHFQSDTLFFSDVPRADIPADCSPGEITLRFHDKTTALNILLEGFDDWHELLGELQLSYIVVLLGQNYSAFMQWKSLVILFCHCETAVAIYPELFTEFIRILHCQLGQAPDDFFQDDLLAGNFLVRCLSNLCEVCSDPGLPELLHKRVGYLKSAISEKFRMSIEDLENLSEDAPVIVDESTKLISFSD